MKNMFHRTERPTSGTSN